MLLTHDSSAVQPNAAWDASFGTISIVNDPEKGGCLELLMSPTTTPGSGTAWLAAGSASTDNWMSSFAPSKVYLSWWEKLSPDFVGNNGAGGQKNAWILMQDTYLNQIWGIELNNIKDGVPDPTGDVHPCFSLYNCDAFEGNTFSPTVASCVLPYQGNLDDPGDVFPRGVWAHHEILFEFNSDGVADGYAQYWLNSVAYPKLRMDNPNTVEGLIGTGLRVAMEGGPRATSFSFNNTWGGGGTPLPCLNYYRFKDFYLSGGYARPGEEPTSWTISKAAEETSTPAAGSTVELYGQLFDGNGDRIAVFGPTLQPTLHVTGPATVRRHNGNRNFTGSTFGAFAVTSNFDIQNATGFSYLNGVNAVQRLAPSTLWDTGTTATIAAGKWNAANLNVDTSGNPVLTWANAAGGASYADEATALAALPSIPGGERALGTVTIQAGASLWTPGTDALAGGTGGTPAAATNFHVPGPFATHLNFDVRTSIDLMYSNGVNDIYPFLTLNAGAVFDTGTTATITAGKWNAALLNVDKAGNPVIIWAHGAGAAYDTEADALAALPACPLTQTPCMRMTVQAGALTWTPGTDALADGTGGTPAAATNYYGVFSPYMSEHFATAVFTVSVNSDASIGADIAITMEDYAKVNNGADNGTHRTSNTVTLTVA